MRISIKKKEKKQTDRQKEKIWEERNCGVLGICISRKPVAVANRYVRGPPSPWRPAIGPSVPGTTLSCPAQRCGIFSAHVRSSRRLAAHHVPVARGMQRSAARPAAFLVRRGRSLAHASIGRNATSRMQGPDSRMMMQHMPGTWTWCRRNEESRIRGIGGGSAERKGWVLLGPGAETWWRSWEMERLVKSRWCSRVASRWHVTEKYTRELESKQASAVSKAVGTNVRHPNVKRCWQTFL